MTEISLYGQEHALKCKCCGAKDNVAPMPSIKKGRAIDSIVFMCAKCYYKFRGGNITVIFTTKPTKPLHLNVRKKWFDMILAGMQKEVYCDYTEYWSKRITGVSIGKKGKIAYNNIVFSNGYRKDRRQVVVTIRYVATRTGILELGAVLGKKYFVFNLGNVIKKVRC